MIQIEKTKTIQTLLEHQGEGTLFLVDLDNTLFEGATSYGSYEWMAHQIQGKLKGGMLIGEALDAVVPKWEGMLDQFEMKLVEAMAPLWIKTLVDANQPVLALTGRSKTLASHTSSQLKEHGLAFSQNLIQGNRFNQEDSELCHNEGVVFIGYKGSKGEALLSILAHLDQDYQKVVFIDDQIRYIEQAAAVLEKAQIPYIGLHYTALENKMRDFNMELAKEEERLFHERS